MDLKFNNNKESKNEKKQIWMYALILFTIAFIVLLLTAYSQVKYQNNISEYQNKLSTEQKEKVNAFADYNTAVQNIEKLKKEVTSLQNNLIKSEHEIAVGESKAAEVESLYYNTIVSNNKLMSAYEDYNNKNYKSCAITLKYDINTEFLSSKGKSIYNDLVQKSYKLASQLLYKDGVEGYRKQNFDQAIIGLTRAIDFSNKDEYYYDDACYYLARSYFKTSRYNEAKELVTLFLKENPKSEFIDGINKLYNDMVVK